MTCLHPMIRAETWEMEKAKDGHLYYKSEFLPALSTREFEYLAKSGRYRKIEKTNCGQCTECRLQKSRDWGTKGHLQMLYEKPNTNWFITFTYSDEYLPTHHTVDTETGEVFEGISINKIDMEKMWKRLRKRYPTAHIKYLAAGEYGGKTMRPHYHAIIYGLPLDTTQFEKIGMSKLMQPEWTTKELTESPDNHTMPIWPYGNITIGEATFEAIAYVARYTMKKATNHYEDWWYKSQGIMPEWLHWSNGIGMQYYKDYRDKIYQTDSVPVKNKKTGKLVKPPLSYDRKYKEYDPEHFEYIKQKRKEAGEYSEIMMLEGTDDNIYEVYRKMEERTKQKYKDLREEI